MTNKRGNFTRLRLVYIMGLVLIAITSVVLISQIFFANDSKVRLYNRQDIQAISDELSSIGRSINKISSLESSWVDESICRRYPPMSVADRERFTCFVVFKSEVSINSQNDVDKLIDEHVRVLASDALLSNIKLDKKPIYTDDRLTLQSSSYDKSAQLGSVSFRIKSSPGIACGLSYELAWNNEIYIEQVLHCNVDTTGEFF